MQDTGCQYVGGAVYILPVLFVYVAVEIFRAEQYKLPLIMKFGTALLIVWCAGISGLLFAKTPASIEPTQDAGGFIGHFMNQGMLSLVEAPVAIFIYILLIL